MRSQTLSRYLLASLILISTGWGFLTSRAIAASTKDVAVPLPVASSQTSCLDAISLVEADLAERGYFIPWEMLGPRPRQIQPGILISEYDIETFYYGYPTERTHTVTFALSGDMDRLYLGLMSSPQLMSIYSAQIMAECEQVGLVEFAHWWEGAIPVGYFPDQTARPFTWIDLETESHHTRLAETIHGTTVQYEWGYYFSP